MRYDKLYKKTSDIADQILSGTYERRRPEVDMKSTMGKGIVPRRKQEQEQMESYDPADDMLTQYFVAIRQQNQELKNSLQSPQEGAGGGSSGSGRSTPFTPIEGDLGAAREALATIESSGAYDAVGPVVSKGAYKGDRAYGRYQVMGKNIPSWTKEILGKRMTPEEFLADPEAQDRVVEARLQQSYDRYGTWEDAASVWFTGQPIATNKNRDDGYTSANEYVSKFRNALKGVA